MRQSIKDSIQEQQYEFPYHFLPDIRDEVVYSGRVLQYAPAYMGYINHVVHELTQPTTEWSTLLDVGCGDGRLLYELEKTLADTKQLTGIDISDKALRFAAAFTEHSTLTQHDIIQAPLSSQFDVCTYIETIEHIPPDLIAPMIANIARSLTPGGTLLLTTPTTNVPTHHKHYQHFTEELLADYLTPHFTIVETAYLNREYWVTKWLQRVLVNRLFVLQSTWVRRHVLRLYNQHCLHATKHTGSRIYIKAVKT